MNAIIILLAVICINPIPLEKETIHVDGYIEINHFWETSSYASRTVKGKDVYYGTLKFDQVLVKKYNKKYGRFDVVHAAVTNNARHLTMLQIAERTTKSGSPEETKLRQEIKDEQARDLEEWEKEHIRCAKELNVDIPDIVVYHANKWLGPQGLLNNPQFDAATGRYEVYLKPKVYSYDPNNKADTGDCGIYKFTAQELYETNTLFDPESQSANEQGVSSGSLGFKGYKYIFAGLRERKLKNKVNAGIFNWPKIDFNWLLPIPKG